MSGRTPGETSVLSPTARERLRTEESAGQFDQLARAAATEAARARRPVAFPAVPPSDLEAMRAGLAVVARDLDGYLRLVLADNSRGIWLRNGILFALSLSLVA